MKCVVDMNCHVRAKLRKKGVCIAKSHRESINISPDGEIRVFFWEFVRIFGPYMSMGFRSPLILNQIELEP